MPEFYDDGSAFQFQISDSSTEPGNPDGTHAIIAPHFRYQSFAEFVDDFQKWIRNLYRCNNWHKCLHADKLDGKHGSEYQDQCDKLDNICAITDNGFLTFTSDAAAVRTLIAGNGINITPTDGSADPTWTLGSFSGFSSATVATGDLVAITDIDDSNSIKKVTAQSIADLGGGGDVSASANMTDNAVIRGDGGLKGVQDSGVLIDDSDNVSGVVNLAITGYHDFTEISEPTDPGANVLRMWAEDNNGFSFPHLKDDNGTAIELARDSVHVVRNNTGSTITAGTPVYFNGSTGVVPTIAEAQADAESTLPAVGILPADIGTASFGLVVTGGDVSGFDTSGFSAGDILYVSASAAGTLTATTPSGDSEFIQRVGVVVKSAAGAAGIVAVQPTTVRPVVHAIANGGTGASSGDGAIEALMDDATDEAVTSVATNWVPLRAAGGGIVALDDLMTGIINNATNDTSPNRQVEFIARDGSGNLRSVLFDDLHPNGQAYVQEIATYTGSGSTGKTVTLTGINRTHHIEIFPVTGATAGRYGNPDGATGAFATRYEAGTGVTTAFTSLDAPAAGTAQTLTLTTGDASVNSSGVTYMVFVVGTPT